MSSTSKYILVNINNNSSIKNVYLSTNFGSNFSIISFFTDKNIGAFSISSSGQYMIIGVLGSFLYRSIDYGATWNQITTLSKNWTSIVLSDDGKYCFTSDNNPGTTSYLSANFDTTTPTFSAKSIYSNVVSCGRGCSAISSDGQYIILLVPTGSTIPGIAISNNYGSTFTKLDINNIGLPNSSYNHVVMKPDASIVYLTVYGQGLYKSTTLWSGSPVFTKITSPAFIGNTSDLIRVSSDGTYLIFVGGKYVYYSINSGTTWVQCFFNNYSINSLSMSKDGHISIITVNTNSKLLLSNT